MKWKSSSLYKSKVKFNWERFSLKNLIYNYMPLVGNEAVSIYLFLFTEATNGITSSIFLSHDRFRKITNLSKEEIILALSKLELFGLVEVFYNEKEDRVMYILDEPLELDYFEKDFISTYLVSKLGVENAKINETFLSLNSIDKYTKDFELKTESKEVWFNFDKNISKKTLSLNVNFSLEPLLKLFKSNNIDYSSWLSNEFKKQLIDSIIIYQLSLLDVYLIIEQILLSKNLINFNNYFKELKKYTKMDSLWVDKILENEVENIGKIKLLETLTPSQFISLRLKRETLDNELSLIKELKSKYLLSNTQINLLIDFSLIKNNQKIISNYILKIAQTIKDQKINETTSLINFLTNALFPNKRKQKVYEFEENNLDTQNNLNQDIEKMDFLISKSKNQNK